MANSKLTISEVEMLMSSIEFNLTLLKNELNSIKYTITEEDKNNNNVIYQKYTILKDYFSK